MSSCVGSEREDELDDDRFAVDDFFAAVVFFAPVVFFAVDVFFALVDFRVRPASAPGSAAGFSSWSLFRGLAITDRSVPPATRRAAP